MASTIKIQRSETPGSTPSTLELGELAVNIPDRRLWVGNTSLSPILISSNSVLSLTDEDGDTLVQVEEAIDDDTFRIDVGDAPAGYSAVTDILTLSASGWTVDMGSADLSNTGASISFTAGDSTGNGDGGDISLIPGETGGSGNDGQILIGAGTNLGTEALPLLAINGDPDTGIWSEAANELNVSTGAGKRASFTSAGLTLEADLLLVESAGGQVNTVAFSAPGTVVSHTYTWPVTGPLNGSILQTDGSGNLSWVATPASTSISDGDADTIINTEETADEDIIRVDVGDSPAGFGPVTDLMTISAANVVLQMGTSPTATVGGAGIHLQAGTANTSGTGGVVIVEAGSGGSTGPGGSITLRAGDGPDGTDGQILLSSNGVGAATGTAALPALAFEGDPDTGVWGETGNEFNVSTGGAKRISIDSTGLTVEQDVFILGTTAATSNTTGALQVTGGASIQQDLYVGQEVFFQNDMQVDGDSVMTGTLSINSTTAATSNTTGALTVAGGASVEQDLYVGQETFLQNDLQVDGDTTITGDLTVNGTTTTVNSTTVTIDDSLLSLAPDNTGSDTIDIGWYGTYEDSGTKYAGIFRDASDGAGIFKVWAGLTAEPTTTVNLGSGALAQLDAVIDGGSF